MVNIYRKFWKTLSNLCYDLRFGGFLGGVKTSPFRDLGAYDSANSDYAVLNYLFKEKPSENSKIVDVGCGKGRVLNWLIDRFPENDIIGIEIDASLAKKVQHRLKKWKNVQVLHQDITKDMPEGMIIFYLFNPFDDKMMKKFIDRLLLKIEESEISTESYIIYYNPMHIDVFYSYKNKFTFKDMLVPSFAHSAVEIGFVSNDSTTV